MKSKEIWCFLRTSTTLAVAPFIAATVVSAFPANALELGTQDTIPLDFSGVGNGKRNLVPPLTFATFKPSDIPPNHKDPTLIGYRFYFKSFEINVVKVETGTALTIPHLTLRQKLVVEFTEPLVLLISAPGPSPIPPQSHTTTQFSPPLSPSISYLL